MMSEEDAQAGAQIRVWLLGPFLVEHQVEEGQWEPVKQATWNKYYAARPFLQRLLCAPARRVERSTLLEDLWPQSEQSEAAERYPKDAAYHLRRVLGDRELVTTFGNGSGYELADQSLIWTDVDAVEALLIECEREGHASPEACSRLEQALQYLERGSFLERQMGTWSQTRRTAVERMGYRIMLWLAEADTQQGRLVQAEQRYSRMLETDPLDEMVWYRLLALLHQQGMLTQMHQSAQQMKATFEQEEVELSDSTKGAVRRLLKEPPPLELFVARSQNKTSHPFSNGFSHDLLDRSEIPDDFVNQFLKAMKTPSLLDTSTLQYFESRTAMYWQDRHGAMLPSGELVSYALEHFNRAVSLLENPMVPSIRARLCSDASEIAQLVGHLLFDIGDYVRARTYHRAAIIAAQEAGNDALQAVAWARMSFTWTYTGDPDQALTCIQKARQFASSVTTTVRAYLAAVQAEIQAVKGERQACFKALEDAEKFEEDQGSREESYWLRFDYSRLVGYQGACFRQLYSAATVKDQDLLKKSHKALTDALKHLAPNKIQRQPLLLMDLADVYVKQGAVKEACECASQALLVPTQLKSQIVAQRLLTLQNGLQPWQETSYVRDMSERMTSLSMVEKGDSQST